MKYATSRDTLTRLEFLSGRIVRQEEFYAKTRNSTTKQEMDENIKEKVILNQLLEKQRKDEQR